MSGTRSHRLDLDDASAQSDPICAAQPIIIDQAQAAQIVGYTRVRRSEDLLRNVIGALVQGTRRHENPFVRCGRGFSGWFPEAV